MSTRLAIVSILLCATGSASSADPSKSASGLDACDGSDFAVCMRAVEQMRRDNPVGAYVLLSWMCDNDLEEACIAQRKALPDYKANAPRVMPSWAAGCRAGNAVDCFAFGLVGQFARPEPIVRVAPYLERACDGGEFRACSRLAWHLMIGLLPHDENRGRNLYRRVCATRHFACNQVAEWLVSAEGGHNYPEARRLAELDCAGSHPRGCLTWGQVLNGMGGGPRDVAAASAAWTRGCELGSSGSCGLLAQTQSRGELGEEAKGRARGNFARACEELHDFTQCYWFAREEQKAGRYSEAAALDEKACDAGNFYSCLELGRCIANGKCAGEKTRAVYLFDKSCSGKVSDGCVQLARAEDRGMGGPPDHSAAIVALKQGCELKNAFACHRVATELRKVGADAEADAAAQKACALAPSYCATPDLGSP
jgi:TPR repeat protein